MQRAGRNLDVYCGNCECLRLKPTWSEDDELGLIPLASGLAVVHHLELSNTRCVGDNDE